jgi:hypothetical protein
MRGVRKKREQGEGREDRKTGDVEVIDASDNRSTRIPLPMWRECIKKVWEVEPLSCPPCHTEMKIISIIVQSDVLRKILVYLEMWEELGPRRPPPLDLARDKSGVSPGLPYKAFDDGWSGYEEPWVDVHSL